MQKKAIAKTRQKPTDLFEWERGSLAAANLLDRHAFAVYWLDDDGLELSQGVRPQEKRVVEFDVTLQ